MTKTKGERGNETLNKNLSLLMGLYSMASTLLIPKSVSGLKAGLTNQISPKEWWRNPFNSSPQRSSRKLKHQIRRREASKRSRRSRKNNRDK